MRRYTYGIFWKDGDKAMWWLCSARKLATMVAKDRQAIMGRISYTPGPWDAPTFKALMDPIADYRPMAQPMHTTVVEATK